MAKLHGYILRLAKWVLKKRYGFERWHVTSLDQRKYATDIISYANLRVKRDNCIEIGCGLGDIIRNLKYQHRQGMDIDQKVLNGAKFISRITNNNDIQFGIFHFPEDELQGSYDLVIMVNWIHAISAEQLKEQIQKIFFRNLLPGGEIIIDTVHDEGYQYWHEAEFLTNGLNCSLYQLGKYIRQREVWAIKKS